MKAHPHTNVLRHECVNTPISSSVTHKGLRVENLPVFLSRIASHIVVTGGSQEAVNLRKICHHEMFGRYCSLEICRQFFSNYGTAK
jgi:hypothetical protein